MSKYTILLNVLDQIRQESLETKYLRYLPPIDDIEAVNQARARAHIHLFLKVRFGLLDFSEREEFVTDGTADGGIDGYFIDRENRRIYFIQSKFRSTASNFEEKSISLDEMMSMDIDRITSGEQASLDGKSYNGKILSLTRKISEIKDISRYEYQVILLANIKTAHVAALKTLIGGYQIEVFDASRCYTELVFPIACGTYFQKDDLHILLDLRADPGSLDS